MLIRVGKYGDKDLLRFNFKKRNAIVFALILSIFLGIVTSHRVYLSLIQKFPMPNFSSKIETNFFEFEMKSFGIAPRNERLISATKQKSEEETALFVSNRENGKILEFSFHNGFLKKQVRLEKLREIDLHEISTLASENAVKYFVFDLEFDKDNLLLSLVSIHQSKKECDKFQIVSIPFSSSGLITSNSKQIWSSDVCIHTYPNDPGWHDFQGRIAVTDNSIYLTAGLIIASTYQGFYPNTEIDGLAPELKIEIERDQLFGGVIKIDKLNGNAVRIAQGFRGPSGIAARVGLKGDEIWVVDHGPRGGDELNLILKGKDYGWPWVSYGRRYFNVPPDQKGTIPTSFGTHIGYQEPVYFWTPSIAPSQISFLTESLDSERSWAKGDLLLSTLKAKSLFRIKLNQEKRVQSYEQVVIGARIRDLSTEGKTIFISTDDGRLIILNEAGEPDSIGAFPEVYPLDSEIYFVIPGLREFSILADKVIMKISLFFSR